MELEVEYNKKNHEVTVRVLAAGDKVDKKQALKILEDLKSDIFSDYDDDLEIVLLDEEEHVHDTKTRKVLRGTSRTKR